MKSPKTSSLFICRISKANFVLLRYKDCHHFSSVLSQKNRHNIQKQEVLCMLHRDYSKESAYIEQEPQVCMLSSGKLSWLYTQAPHRTWKAAALGTEKNFKEANCNTLIMASYLAYVLSIPFPVPLKGLPNQQNDVSITWAECPLKLLNVSFPGATTHWLHQACGGEVYFPSWNNLRSGPRKFRASHNQCDTINNILHSSALPFHICLSKCVIHE